MIIWETITDALLYKVITLPGIPRGVDSKKYILEIAIKPLTNGLFLYDVKKNQQSAGIRRSQ